jgi:hypothetical protein
LSISPFSNVAPGIAANFSWQYSRALALRERFELLGRRVARQHVAQLRAYGREEAAEQRAAELRHAVHDAAILEKIQNIDERNQVLVLRHAHGAGEIGVGLRHEPEAHLRDDAEVRLREQSVDPRTRAELVLLPRLRVRHGAHAGAQQLAVREYHLHAAVRIEVIAELRHRVAAAVIERVADQAAPTRVRAVHPNVELVLLDVAIEIEVAHARLDERRRVLLADLEDAVHALQVEHDAPREIRSRAAVTQVLTGRDRVERNPVGVRGAHDRPHLLHRVRRDGRRSGSLLGLALERGVRVAVERDVGIAREHPLRADCLLEGAQCAIEVRLRHAAR